MPTYSSLGRAPDESLESGTKHLEYVVQDDLFCS